MKYKRWKIELLAIGVMISCIALLYAGGTYLNMRYMEIIVKSQNTGNNIVADKLEKLSGNTSSERRLFLSEIRDKGKRLALLQTDTMDIVSRAKLFAEIQIALWLISASGFSILLYLEEKERRLKGCT